MARRPHFHGLEVLEQDSGLDTPIFDKQRKLEITSEQLKKDLNDLESRIPGAQKIVYDTQILSIRNDLDHLMNKTKGIEKTHQKTERGGRGLLGRKQDRMKLRTAVNEVSLAAINAKVDQLDDKVYKELGIESERQHSKQLARTLGITTTDIVNSGVLKVDAQGKVIGYDEAKFAALAPTLQKNIDSGRSVWEGDVNVKNVVNSGAQGIIGGGMDKLGYSNKNINNVVNIAKILAGLMILKTYWEKTDGFGEKLGWGIGLYALLSSDALGGWDMFWEGGKNGVLDVNGIINRAKGQPGVSPEAIQQKEVLLKGKDRVKGIKILFRDPQKLKEYLKNEDGKWTFDNQKFVSNYGLDAPIGQNPVAKEGYSIGDINDPAAKCVLIGLIGSNKYGGNAQLNDMINTYLQATDFKTPEDVINASPNDLNTEANDALAKIDKEQAQLEVKKLREAADQKTELNLWIQSLGGLSGYVIVDGKEELAKSIKEENSDNLTKINDLKKLRIIRPSTNKDVVEVSTQDLQTVEGLKNLRYTTENAEALVSSLMAVKQTLGRADSQPQLVFEGESVFYQNHGKKIEIKSKSPDETMKFDLSSLGLSENLAQGTAGFTSGLLLADALCNIFGYLGTMDQRKIVKIENPNYIEGAKKVPGSNPKTRDKEIVDPASGNEYPFKWNELTGTVEMFSQSDLTSFTNENDQINIALKKAFEVGKGKLGNSKTDHTKIQNLLTNLNGAKITDTEGKQYDAWFEGQGFTIPTVLNAQGASIEQKSNLNVKTESIQTMGDLVRDINSKGMEFGGMIWNDFVRALEQIGGDTAMLMKKAIPEGATIIRMMYEEGKTGVKVLYDDGKGAIGEIYNDGTFAFRTAYMDGRCFTIDIISNDIRDLGTWSIETAGGWTKELTDQIVGVVSNIMKPENLKALIATIDGLGDLATKTMDETINLVAKGMADVLKIPTQTFDHMTRGQIAGALGTFLGRKFMKNKSAYGAGPTPSPRSGP